MFCVNKIAEKEGNRNLKRTCLTCSAVLLLCGCKFADEFVCSQTRFETHEGAVYDAIKSVLEAPTLHTSNSCHYHLKSIFIFEPSLRFHSLTQQFASYLEFH